MKSIARINRKDVDEEVFQEVARFAKLDASLGKENQSLTVIDLFRHPQMRTTTILLCIMWMSTTFVFDGHARNAGSIGTNLFVAHTLGSFTEFPVDIFLVLILDKWGRRWPCASALILGGVFSLTATVVPFGKYNGVPSQKCLTFIYFMQEFTQQPSQFWDVQPQIFHST